MQNICNIEHLFLCKKTKKCDKFEKEDNLKWLGLCETFADAEKITLTHKDVHAYNTFESPFTVIPVSERLRQTDALSLPKASVICLRCRFP